METRVHTKPIYQNQWIRFAGNLSVGGKPLLQKSIKKDFFNVKESWDKEDKKFRRIKDVLHVTPIDKATTAKGNKRTYDLPVGLSLFQVIQNKNITLTEKTKIASDLVQILVAFNKQKLFHCDFNWHLIWYDVVDQSLYLLDNIMMVKLDTIREHYHIVLGLEPDMNCMSPEQTFQTSSMPDERSNYYSLGIILYALFTHRIP